MVVVSLFDGIGALMCGPCRLPCRVVGVIELGDITKITSEVLDRSVGFSVDPVLCGWGGPCQDLSALLANGEGLAGSRSKLVFEMPRIFKDLRQEFSCPVFTFVENVFSMTSDNRAQFTDTLGVQTANPNGLHILFLLSSPSTLLGRLAR